MIDWKIRDKIAEIIRGGLSEFYSQEGTDADVLFQNADSSDAKAYEGNENPRITFEFHVSSANGGVYFNPEEIEEFLREFYPLDVLNVDVNPIVSPVDLKTIGILIHVYPLPKDAGDYIGAVAYPAPDTLGMNKAPDCLPYDMTPFRFPHTEDLKDGH